MQQPNILLVVMDTARADCVENERVMPNLHEFGESGVWFSNAFSNAPWTLPSHASLFTGKYPSKHGTTGVEKYFDSDTTLMSELADEGYRTIAFSNNPWISPDFGFDGFDKFVPCWQPFRRGADIASISQKEGLKRQLRALASKLGDIDAPFTLANALYMKFIEGRYDSGAALTNYRIKQWLKDSNTNKPFFGFVNYMEPHLKYNPPKKHREQFLSEDELNRWEDLNQDPWAYVAGTVEMTDADFEILQNLYRAELHYLDARLEHLFEFLRETGELDSTVVIITGDHGEHLGEYGLMDHQYSLSDYLLQVPLLIRHPDEFGPGTRDNRLVELRDLFKTVLSIAGTDDTDVEETAYPSLDLTEENESRDAVIAEYPSPQPDIDTLCARYGVSKEMVEEFDRSLRTIRTSDRKFVETSDGSQNLYAVTEDYADETRPLNEPGDELRAKLQSVIGEFSMNAEKKGSRELAESNKQRLENLGYL